MLKRSLLMSVVISGLAWNQMTMLETSGSIDLGSQAKKSVALAGAQRVTKKSFDAIVATSKVRKSAKKSRVGIVFDGKSAPETEMSNEEFLEQMRKAKPGRAKLPVVVVANHFERPRRPVLDAYDDEPSGHESLRTSVAPRSRSTRSSSFTLIPMAGVNNSRLIIDGGSSSAVSVDSFEVTSTPGFLMGALVEVGQSRFSFQSGLVYMKEGAHVEARATSSYGDVVTSSVDMRVHYIGIPALLKISSGSAGETRFSVKGGVIPVFMPNVDITETESISYNGYVKSETTSKSTQDNIRKFNVLAQAGLGLLVPMNTNLDFRIEALYSRSLLPLTQDTWSGSSFTQSFSGTLGLGFGI